MTSHLSITELNIFTLHVPAYNGKILRWLREVEKFKFQLFQLLVLQIQGILKHELSEAENIDEWFMTHWIYFFITHLLQINLT